MNYPTVSVQADEEQQEDVSMEATVTRQFGDSNPASIRVSITNDSDSEMEFTFGASPPFSEYVSEKSSSSRLVLIPETDNSHIVVGDGGTNGTDTSDDGGQLPPKTTVDGCWELFGDLTVYTRATKRRIGAGETVSQKYAVLNHPSNKQCLPTNDYRFVSKNYFGQDESWGLTVGLQD